MANKLERDEKSRVLGMPISTAGSKLRKALLFKYVQLAGDDTCYRCNQAILKIEEFSIEHKHSWLYHPDGRTLYFNLDNIAFSHITCNSAAEKLHKHGVSPNKGKPSPHRKIGPKGTAWCGRGKHFTPLTLFGKDTQTWNGLKWECNPCRSANRRQRYKEGKSR